MQPGILGTVADIDQPGARRDRSRCIHETRGALLDLRGGRRRGGGGWGVGRLAGGRTHAAPPHRSEQGRDDARARPRPRMNRAGALPPVPTHATSPIAPNPACGFYDTGSREPGCCGQEVVGAGQGGSPTRAATVVIASIVYISMATR